jgi:hypothetical protein
MAQATSAVWQRDMIRRHKNAVAVYESGRKGSDGR